MGSLRRSWVLGPCIGVLVAALLGGGQPASAASRYTLKRVTTADNPVGVTVAPGSTTLLVVEQTGRIRPLVSGRLGSPVLDVSDEISSGGERGLLGTAWSRSGDRLYVDFTNTDGDTEIREYRWTDGRADAASSRLLLTIDQPFSNHNGGQLVVDTAGLLWIGMGDGGSAGDPGKRAQNRHELLGKILRIDPTPTADKPYSIPPDNPFADGVDGAPEVWAYGLRNPWRFAIDETGKRLIVGDVGQNTWEEVDVVPLNRPGANLGWNAREGTHAYEDGSRPAGAIDPVYEYKHPSGCSVTGGVVYRGTALRELRGTYLFGDYCEGWIAALRPGIGASWSRISLGVKLRQLTSFGVDAKGEIWVTSGGGAVSQLVRR